MIYEYVLYYNHVFLSMAYLLYFLHGTFYMKKPGKIYPPGPVNF